MKVEAGVTGSSESGLSSTKVNDKFTDLAYKKYEMTVKTGDQSDFVKTLYGLSQGPGSSCKVPPKGKKEAEQTKRKEQAQQKLAEAIASGSDKEILKARLELKVIDLPQAPKSREEKAALKLVDKALKEHYDAISNGSDKQIQSSKLKLDAAISHAKEVCKSEARESKPTLRTRVDTAINKLQDTVKNIDSGLAETLAGMKLVFDRTVKYFLDKYN